MPLFIHTARHYDGRDKMLTGWTTTKDPTAYTIHITDTDTNQTQHIEITGTQAIDLARTLLNYAQEFPHKP